MRRLILLVTLVVVMAAITMALPGTAFAQSGPTQGNPSCFGEFARSTPGPPGPGQTVVQPATTLAAPGLVDDLARFVGLANQVRPCPATTP